MLDFVQNNKVCVAVIAVAVVAVVILLILYLTKKDANCEFKDNTCSLRKSKEGFVNTYAARPTQYGLGSDNQVTGTWGRDPLDNRSGFRSGFSGREPPVFWPQGDIAATRGSRSASGYKILSDRYHATRTNADGSVTKLFKTVNGKSVPVMVQKVQLPDGSVVERTAESVSDADLSAAVARYNAEKDNVEGMSADDKLLAAAQGFRSY
jgi:hypothetical protein